MTLFVDQETRQRVNIHAAYKGFSKLDTPEIRERAGVIEIPDPTPPEDFSDDTYYVTHQNEAPYVVYTRKSDEQIAQAKNSKLQQQIDSEEKSTLLPRVTREFMLAAFEAQAAVAGITKAQLIDPDSPHYAPGYARMNELDDRIKGMRQQIVVLP